MGMEAAEIPRYDGPTRRCLTCSRDFRLREVVLVHISNQREVFCNEPIGVGCAARYYRLRARKSECMPMFYAGGAVNGSKVSFSVSKYSGPKTACVQCEREFERHDLMRVWSESVVFCIRIDRDCATLYRNRKRLRRIPTERMMYFPGPTVAARARGFGRRIVTFLHSGPSYAASFTIIFFAFMLGFLAWLLLRR